MSEYVNVPSAAAFEALVADVAELSARVDAHTHDGTPAPNPAPEPDPAEPEPTPAPAALTNLSATVDGPYVVLAWDGHAKVHLSAEDYDADGELIDETDQGVVVGSPQRRGPMGRRDGAGYRFAASPVYDDGTEGELYVFPRATFPVESERPAPPPAKPKPKPSPAPSPEDGELVAFVPFDGTTTDPFAGLRTGDSGWRQWSDNGPNTFEVVEHKGKMRGRAQITGGPHSRDIRAEGIVVELGTDDEVVKFREDDELWFGDTILIGEGFPARHFNNVVQWKNDGTGSAPLYFGAWDNGMQLRTSGRTLRCGDIDFGEEHRYVFGIKFGSNNRGWVEVWRDGVQTLERTPASTLHPGLESYGKPGYYRGDEIAGDGAVFHYHFKIGTTYESVA